MTTHDLRFLLRRKTQQAHARLDAALVEHDLTTVSGLKAYLDVHFLARQHLQNMLSGYENLRDDTKKIASLKADFDVLGVAPPCWKTAPKTENHHTLGLIYVLAGSALGSKLLFRHWSVATDPLVLRVKNFMTAAKNDHVWNKFLTHVDITPFKQAEIDEIIDAANYCFGVFESANNEVSEIL